MNGPPGDTVLTDEELANLTPRWHTLDVIGLVCGLVPFALSASETETSYVETTPDGGMTVGTRTVKHADYVAIGGGVLALGCALVGLLLTLRRIGKAKGRRALRFAVFSALLFLGVLQLARGFGVLAGLSG